MSKVTVAIPTYNREIYLKEAIKSVLAQSFQDFEIIIFDNHSDFNIECLILGFEDSRIKLISSDNNIGGIKNLEKAFGYKYNSDYVIVFHDDDVMHPELLRTEVEILEKDKNIVLVGTDLNFIKDDKLISKFKALRKKRKIRTYNDHSDLIRLILKDFDLCFDSVMYRTDSLIDFSPYHERFSKWSDRPFIIAIAKKGNCAIIDEKLVSYRIHISQDSQSGAPAAECDRLLGLFEFYRDNLPQPLKRKDKCLFYRFATNQMVLSGLGFSNNFREYRDFLKLAKEKGLFNLRYLNIRGLYYFTKVLRKFL